MTPVGSASDSCVGVSMGRSSVKRLVFPSDLGESAKALQAVLADVRANGFSEIAFFAIRLALDEALSNAVRHGNGGDPAKHVTIEYNISDRAFEASVTDEGLGFAPNQIPDPTQQENLDRPCGRGVMLMKAYMSRVSFNKQGNQVTLIKNRDCVLPDGGKK